MNQDNANPHAEFDQKVSQLRRLRVEKNLDGILLQRASSIAWVTCGADTQINTAASDGVASLLITPQEKFLFTTNIEAARLEKEEGLGSQGWKFQISPWYAAGLPFEKFIANKRIGCDGLYGGAVDISGEMAWMRACLNEFEVGRFKALAAICAEGMNEAIRAVKPGMTEFQMAGMLAGAVEQRGALATVNLTATDERIFNYRHPLPTSKKLRNYAILILCGRKWGLVCSITRLVYFGKLTDEIRQKSQAVAQIDAAMIAATRPGRTLGDVFRITQQAYAASGYADEWQKHHQGGLAGYEPREITATPESSQPVLRGQAFAWNPSITGAKSEDTILVNEKTNQILTEIIGWPVITCRTGEMTIERPDILVVD